MSIQKPKIPVIFLSVANERSEDGFLRQLTTELKDIMWTFESAVRRQRVQLKVVPAVEQEEIAAVFQDEWYEDRVWVFHYGGHADEEGLWLENGAGGNQAFFSMGLSRFLGAQQGLKLVFLNACATAAHAEALVQHDIPAVIATSRKISDVQARKFARIFYRGLANGATILESYQEAEGMLLGEFGPDAFRPDSQSGALMWEDAGPLESGLDLPWRLFHKPDADFFLSNWRLFHALKAPSADTQAGDPAMFVGEEINNYRIEELLGVGSMGAVYRAVHSSLNEERAIKITHRVRRGYELLKDVVLAGNKGLSSIEHPNVVRFYDVGEVVMEGEKRLYMVMELVKGERLDKVDHTPYRQDPERFVDLAVQVASGLEAAHNTKFTDAAGMPREGIVHGNIKTRKILFTPEGKPKLIDFMFTDLSRSPQIELAVPSAVVARDRAERIDDFFPPEVLKGKAGLSRLTDIYALGAVFFEVITDKRVGEVEWERLGDMHELLRNQSRKFPLHLSQVIYDATHPDPEARTQTVGALIDALLSRSGWIKKLMAWFRRI
jgi:hypothetical protein